MIRTLMIVAYLMSHPTGGIAVPGVFELSSPAFKNAGIIPDTYTCRGHNISIPLKWKGVPQKAKSLVVIMLDQDVPRNQWYHWAVYNIPPTMTGLQDNYHPKKPTQIASNSWKNAEYKGPCPPTDEHHYIIQLYALDKKLPDAPTTTLQLREAMRDHILASTEIMGRSMAPATQWKPSAR